MAVASKKSASKKPAAKQTVSAMGPENGKAPVVAKAASAQKSVKPAAAQKASKVDEQAVKQVGKQKPAKEKVKKTKLVRDSFAMPEVEYEVLRDMKRSCMKAGVDIKKSELLRVGVALLKKQTPADIQAALAGLVPLKAGRPKKAA